MDRRPRMQIDSPDRSLLRRDDEQATRIASTRVREQTHGAAQGPTITSAVV